MSFDVPMTAREAIAAGDCSAECLCARSHAGICHCRCRGRFHGRLIDRALAPDERSSASADTEQVVLRDLAVDAHVDLFIKSEMRAHRSLRPGYYGWPVVDHDRRPDMVNIGRFVYRKHRNAQWSALSVPARASDAHLITRIWASAEGIRDHEYRIAHFAANPRDYAMSAPSSPLHGWIGIDLDEKDVA